MLTISFTWLRLSVVAIVIALASGPLAAETGDYLKEVKPLLASRCSSCHGALAQKAKLRLDTAGFIKKGGRGGPAIVPGKSERSLLIDAVLGRDHARMPPENDGIPLSAAQIASLKKWIDAGAQAPPNEPVPEDPRKHWAFQKPVLAAIPVAIDPAWRANPIDGFIAEAHGQHGLQPLPVADRATLLRRVTLDLTGLPPTRQQLHDFLADNTPDAYEKVVDRLLASPQHGERWARHWMDVWRYADWHGRRQEKDWRNSSPTLWRWRDWIVRSLNEDRGYDRMVQDMLAADEIAPEDDAAQAATGFLARNYYSLNHDTWMRDQTEHTAKAFLGLTLNCCHCHNHKYDPITQEEYFRFRAFFEPLGLRQDRVPGEPDPGPYQKYGYGGSGKVVKSGLVRVMDEKLDAKTRMYRLGNDRDFMPDKQPVTPAGPAVIGGDKLTIAPVELPPRAYYPGLKDFIQQEEADRAKANVAAMERDLAKVKAAFQMNAKSEIAQLEMTIAEHKLQLAQRDLASLEARIAADRASYLGDKTKVAELTQEAIRRERDASFGAKELAVSVAQLALAVAEARPANDPKRTTMVQLAAKGLTAARAALGVAQKAVPRKDYTPLSPVYAKVSSGRRKALALWIGSSDNPLTARVAVNHIWMRHFGKPLVESVFDFGLNGKRPSHPELLDWLAVDFMESKWSMKRLHKLIVMSRTYRAQSNPALANPNLAKDSDDRWLWRYPSRRLEAEAVRDALLFVAGDLDAKIGGKELEATEEATSKRRSLYFSCHPEGGGSLKLLEFFDAPDPCDCYRRPESLVPHQALALTNSQFTLERSRSLARQLLAGIKTNETDQGITAAFEQILTRRPTAQELTVCREFLKTQMDVVGKSVPPEMTRQRLGKLGTGAV